MSEERSDPARGTIRLLYSCPLGCVTKRAVVVPSRGAEDVVTWLEKIALPVIATDHAGTSPFCPADSVKDLMIPMSGSERVGEEPRQ